MLFQITTAGDDPVSVCGDQHDYACKILNGVLTDESFFAIICHADATDDWQDPATWAKANPHYGISVNPDDLAAKALKAKSMPAAAAQFKQKHLNLWVSASAPWLSVDGWRAGQTRFTPDDLAHDPCYVGIDLASKIDLCPLVAVFPPTPGRGFWALLRWVWSAADTLKDRAHRDRAPYLDWVQAGYLRTTPGSSVDHQVIRPVLREIRERYDLERVGFDPWHADTLISQLTTEDGFSADQVLAVPQTYQGMSAGALRSIR